MRHLLFMTCVMLFLCSLTGCGTIIHGSSQDITISSSPPGALVRTADGGSFTTPCKVTLKRYTDHVLAVTLNGYHTEHVNLSSVLSGAVAGNIIFGGIIGGAIDAASGAAWRLEPEAVAVTMRPLAPGESAEAVSFAPLTPQQRLANLDRLKNSGNISVEDYEASKKAIEEEIKKQQSSSKPAGG